MTKDSITQFIKEASEFNSTAEARYKEYRGRRGKELELWTQWQEGGKKPEHLTPLLTSLQPLIRSEANKRMQGLGGSIPKSAIENELRNAAVKSLHTYDPAKGAALTTHVTHGFRRISDFVGANRNARYMPAEDVKRFDAFRNATAELQDELGRHPTPEELQARLPQWSLRTITKLQRGFGRELYTEMGDNLSASEQHAELSPRDAFHMARSQLPEQHQEFGKLFFVPEGHQQPSVKNIARTLGIPVTRAYRLKADVESRVGKIIKRQ